MNGWTGASVIVHVDNLGILREWSSGDLGSNLKFLKIAKWKFVLAEWMSFCVWMSPLFFEKC